MHGVFDIVGPVMIGPSSSHTAGAVRLGLMARKILGEPAVKAEINLHGSFAQTYRGHGTDKALIAGILGFAPDDERIREALSDVVGRCIYGVDLNPLAAELAKVSLWLETLDPGRPDHDGVRIPML